MSGERTRIAAMTAFVVSAWVLTGLGQVQAPPQGVLLEPVGQEGEAVYPAFEGFGPTKDGKQQVLLLGYFNRNKAQTLDIPIGPNNRIEPGGPDRGQPTHFHLGRQYGVFGIPVPKDFGDRKLTWTLVANGHTASVSFWTNPPYWIDFYKNMANGNEPPVIKFSPTGAELQGPPTQPFVQTLDATVNQPLTLTMWAADQPPTTIFEADPPQTAAARGRRDARPSGNEPPPAIIGNRVIGSTPGQGGGPRGERRGDVRVLWRKYRGPGDVKVADETIALFNQGDAKRFVEAKTTATFSAPGEYWLRAQVNDSSGDGGGGDQCCWTTTHVRVNVR